ncbi:hypothetical protein [Bernardetia sp. MNP-M8]|uniref:hypothetical protein n=1 Tax=Bernardetia sp. MNP-M8 TaxID=3127470 RepID=UPI0030CEA627
MKIAIALLLYNRPSHCQEVIESLVENNVDDVYAFLDFSEKQEVKENQQKITSLIDQHSDKLNITLYKHKEPKGLKKSVIYALDTLFERGYDGVILLEDDCVLRDGAYKFFKETLISQKDNKNVRSVCGYLPPNTPFQVSESSDLLLMSRFSTWGWATWADRWSDYEIEVGKVLEKFEQAKIDIKLIAPDLHRLANSEKYINGLVDVWSIPWSLVHYLTGTTVIYPRQTLIDNIGLDGSGRNCVYSEDYTHTNNESSKFTLNKNVLPQYNVINESLLKNFMLEKSYQIYPNF